MGAMADSAYEYFLKVWLLTGKKVKLDGPYEYFLKVWLLMAKG